jgi:hypothetical protein
MTLACPCLLLPLVSCHPSQKAVSNKNVFPSHFHYTGMKPTIYLHPKKVECSEPTSDNANHSQGTPQHDRFRWDNIIMIWCEQKYPLGMSLYQNANISFLCYLISRLRWNTKKQDTRILLKGWITITSIKSFVPRKERKSFNSAYRKLIRVWRKSILCKWVRLFTDRGVTNRPCRIRMMIVKRREGWKSEETRKRGERKCEEQRQFAPCELLISQPSLTQL